TREILYVYGTGMVFTKYNNYINILFNYNAGLGAEEIIYAILEEIVEKCKKYLNISLSIGFGNGYSGLLSISKSYTEAIKALELRKTMNKQGVIPVDSIKYNEYSQEMVLNKMIRFVDD